MLLFDFSYCLRCSGDEMLLCLGEYSKESSLLAEFLDDSLITLSFLVHFSLFILVLSLSVDSLTSRFLCT